MATRNFTLGGKSFAATELRTGDLEISGHCVVWDGLDAAGEGFLRGALRDAIPTFLERSGVLAWQHQPRTHPLGRVLEMREDDTGVWFRARVDRPDIGAPTRYLYDAIKRGTMRGVSIAGVFGRRMTAAGQMIDKVLRLTEISLTTHPMDDAPRVRNVVEVKAMMHEADPLAGYREVVEIAEGVHDLALAMKVERLERDVAALRNARGLI